MLTTCLACCEGYRCHLLSLNLLCEGLSDPQNPLWEMQSWQEGQLTRDLDCLRDRKVPPPRASLVRGDSNLHDPRGFSQERKGGLLHQIEVPLLFSGWDPPNLEQCWALVCSVPVLLGRWHQSPEAGDRNRPFRLKAHGRGSPCPVFLEAVLALLPLELDLVAIKGLKWSNSCRPTSRDYWGLAVFSVNGLHVEKIALSRNLESGQFQYRESQDQQAKLPGPR